MKDFFPKLSLWAICSVSLFWVLVPLSQAARRNMKPDFTSEFFWIENHIWLVQVENVEARVPGDDPKFFFKTLEIFSDEKIPVPTVLNSRIWNGGTDSSSNWISQKPVLKKGETIVLCVMKEKGRPYPDLFVPVRFEGKAEESHLVKSLSAISKIRENKNKNAALEGGLKGGGEIVVTYCLKEMLRGKFEKSAADSINFLRKLRGNEEYSLNARLLASQLLSNLDPRSENVSWLKETMKHSKSDSYAESLLLVEALLKSSISRAEVAEFLLSLLSKADANSTTQLTALNALAAPPCFDFKNSEDSYSKKIIVAITDALYNAEPTIRQQAAIAVYRICSGVVDGTKKKEITQRCVSTLKKALNEEKNSLVVSCIESTLLRFEEDERLAKEQAP